MEIYAAHKIKFHSEQATCEILHSSQDLRVLLVGLEPGQSIPPSASSSSVMIQVLSGECHLLSGCGWSRAESGTLRFYPPGEPHGVEAREQRAALLLVLAPRP